MRPIATDRVVRSVGLSVTVVIPSCKNGWTDRDAVWVVDPGGLKEPRIMRWGPDSPCEEAMLGEGHALACQTTLQWAVQKWLNRSICRLGCGFGWAERSMGAHWRQVANTTEPFVCGGDAALCKITLTIYLFYYTLEIEKLGPNKLHQCDSLPWLKFITTIVVKWQADINIC